ncbi:hypothetical protein [Flavobacterium sp.]|uniref:hypothetical protein n=1 Tax=Flavobacterium sp. TaxID=239 RepID=UPI0037BFB129
MFANHMLIESKEYYPFGAFIDNNGELIPVGYKDNETDMPESQKVISELTAHFEDDLRNNKIKAYGVTYDVRVQINDSGDKSDAILIDIVHRDSSEIPQYYFTYSWTEKGELIFGESFGMKR